jgi:hypothetical protein
MIAYAMVAEKPRRGTTAFRPRSAANLGKDSLFLTAFCHGEMASAIAVAEPSTALVGRLALVGVFAEFGHDQLEIDRSPQFPRTATADELSSFRLGVKGKKLTVRP